MINKNYTQKIYNKPFPYIIFEDFFEKDYFDKIIQDFPKIKTFEKEKKYCRSNASRYYKR